MKPNKEQILLCHERLAYFQKMLADSEARTDYDTEKLRENTIKYYQTEVAERTMLLSIWEHLLG